MGGKQIYEESNRSIKLGRKRGKRIDVDSNVRKKNFNEIQYSFTCCRRSVDPGLMIPGYFRAVSAVRNDDIQPES